VQEAAPPCVILALLIRASTELLLAELPGRCRRCAAACSAYIRTNSSVCVQQLLPGTVLAMQPAGVPSDSIAVALGVAMELPLCLFGTFRSLSLFSGAGVASTVGVMALVLSLPIIDPHKASLDETSRHELIGSDVFSAAGIMAVRTTYVPAV
jgi:hypothetical protein